MNLAVTLMSGLTAIQDQEEASRLYPSTLPGKRITHQGSHDGGSPRSMHDDALALLVAFGSAKSWR
jgi:hypothetical protein